MKLRMCEILLLCDRKIENMDILKLFPPSVQYSLIITTPILRCNSTGYESTVFSVFYSVYIEFLIGILRMDKLIVCYPNSILMKREYCIRMGDTED